MKKCACAIFSIAVAALMLSCSKADEQRMPQTTSTAATGESPDLTTTQQSETTSVVLPQYDPPAGYGEWFLSPITYSERIRELPIPAEYENWTLKTPGMVTERKTVQYTVEFFKESYRFGEGLQVRVTVQNTSDRAIECLVNPNFCDILSPDGKTDIDYTPFTAVQAGLQATADFSGKTLAAGDTLVFERLFVIDPAYFDTEGIYTFRFSCFVFGDLAVERDSESIEIPLEAVKG